MDILDFIVFFIWVIIFNFIFSSRRKKYNNPLLKKYHKQAFWIKVFSSLAFCMFILYISPGDTSTLYYPEGYNIYRLILKDPANIKLLLNKGADFDPALLSDMANAGFFDEESNFMVTRIVSILCFFTMGKFLAINLFFSMISFTGVWRLYRFFYEQYPYMHKQFAIAVLYLPTFVFWSSGILKDPICTGALGWITYSMYSIFYTKNNLFRNLLLVCFFGYLLTMLKIYILVSYVPLFSLFLILKNVSLVKNKGVKFLLVTFFMVASIFGFIKLADTFEKALGGFAAEGLTESIKAYQTNYANQEQYVQSNFSLGVEFDGSIGSLFKIAPAAIIATLYRPFLWESKKLSTLLSSVESLVMMLFTLIVLKRVGPRKFISTILSDPMVLYCLLFAVVFALFVGATTLNFGTLVRYKIPAMPFYVIGLYRILDINNKLKKGPNKVRAVVV